MKLSEFVHHAVSLRLAALPSNWSCPPELYDRIKATVWMEVLDELSDEIFKLAGNGLPIQGQRRIAKALGIPAPEAPEQKLGDKAE